MFLFFTAWFNFYNVLSRAVCMSHAQITLNTATCLKHVLIKIRASPRISIRVRPWNPEPVFFQRTL